MSEDHSITTGRCIVRMNDGTGLQYEADAIEPHCGFVVLHKIERDKYGRPILVAVLSANSFSSIEVKI